MIPAHPPLINAGWLLDGATQRSGPADKQADMSTRRAGPCSRRTSRFGWGLPTTRRRYVAHWRPGGVFRFRTRREPAALGRWGSWRQARLHTGPAARSRSLWSLLRNSASHGGVAFELAWWLGDLDATEAAGFASLWHRSEGGLVGGNVRGRAAAGSTWRTSSQRWTVGGLDVFDLAYGIASPGGNYALEFPARG